MAAYPELTAQDLATFDNRPVASYNATYVQDTAIPQAILLFKFATCIQDFPEDPQKAMLANFAILQMASSLNLDNQYLETMASPFNNESIGSYSYSKTYSRHAAAVAQPTNQGTGLQWFDLAVEKLGICELSDPIMSGGGIDVFTHGYMEQDQPNNRTFLSPADLNRSIEWGYALFPVAPIYTDPSNGSASGNVDGGTFSS